MDALEGFGGFRSLWEVWKAFGRFSEALKGFGKLWCKHGMSLTGFVDQSCFFFGLGRFPFSLGVWQQREERRETSYLNWNVFWLGESRPFPPALPQHKQQDGWVLLVTTTCQNLHFRVTYACTSILTASDKLGVKSGKMINCLGSRNFLDFHWFSLTHRFFSSFDWFPSIFIIF